MGLKWVLVVVFLFLGNAGGCDYSPDVDVDTAGICEAVVISQGYKCQEYQVTTQDGYILGMQRIPEGRAGGGGGRWRTPVLLQHGILMDGMTWLLNSPQQSLAFILADNGFDVWIANTRGTRSSRRHQSLHPCSPDYWRWSWDELVTYDLPTSVQFVYDQTGQKLHYVGHSLGTMVALASFSEGKLVDKLRSTALLSPVAYLSHMTTPVGVLAAKSIIGEVTTLLGIAEFNPKGKIVARFLDSLCRHPDINCYDLMTVITGVNCCLNASTVQLFLKYEPQPTSTRTLVHLAQVVRHGVLAKYNYGHIIANMRHYGRPTPPLYDLSNITKDIPLYLSYGGRDSLSDSMDVSTLLGYLKFHDPNKINVQYVENFAHADFVMGTNAKQVVYDPMIQFFNRQ